MSVPVELHEVGGTNVLWINRAWFKSQGIDVSNLTIREEVDEWLISSFSFIVREAQHPASLFTGKVKLACVDRYGGKGLRNAGGSGRCAYVDGFYVKGIGPTPLRDPTGPFFKTHGAMPLQEAVREAIVAQIACAEFPAGGVPPVAILGLAPRFHNGIHDERGEHRALLLRPAFFRLGHLEPATTFINLMGDQHAADDAERVRFCVRAWTEGRLSNDPFPLSLEKIAVNLGAQLAFSRVHRLSHVAYTSSNLTTEGALADFGSFSAFPDWEAAITARGMPPFGQEIPVVTRTILWALSYLLKSAACEAVGSKPSAGVGILKAFQDSFDRTLLVETASLFGLAPDTSLADELNILCRSFFSAQNKVTRNYIGPDEAPAPARWLYEMLQDDAGETGPDAPLVSKSEHSLEEIGFRVRQLLMRSGRYEHAMQTAKRTLVPRTGIFFKEIFTWICDEVLSNRTQSWLAENLEVAIHGRVCEWRRVWRDVDVSISIMGHAQDLDGNTVLWLYNQIEKCSTLRLSIIFVDGHGEFFGQECSASLNFGVSDVNGIMTFELPAPGAYRGDALGRESVGCGLALPQLSKIY